MGICVTQPIQIFVGDGIGLHRRRALLVQRAEAIQVAGELQIDVVVGPRHRPLGGGVVGDVVVVVIADVEAGFLGVADRADIVIGVGGVGEAVVKVVVFI